MSLIQFTGVTKKFGPKEALKDVTCTLRGRSIGLVGPNGAGKTTFMKLCLGLLNRDSGRIEVMGREAGRDVNGRSRFGFAAEGLGVYLT